MHKTVITKATPEKDGKVEEKCSVCSNVKSSKKIYKASKITLSKSSFTYNGKVQRPTVSVKDSQGKVIEKSNYTISWSNKSTKNAGTYKVKVTFKGNSYIGSKTLTNKITKKANTITNVTLLKYTLNAAALKKSSKSFKISATVQDNAKKTFTLKSVPQTAKKYISITKAGKVTVTKGLKAGTYKINVQINAEATANYSAAKVVKTITLTVKK